MASKMIMCNHCNKRAHMLDVDGYICCSYCGKVVAHDLYATEPTYYKDVGGQSRASGILGNCVDYASSYDKTVKKGRDLIEHMAHCLGISGGKSIIDPASAFYKIAVDRNFTRGRSTLLVAAACLYIACREDKRVFLLIDFSEYLMENVYKLGAVFLQLCQLLRLEKNPSIQKPVDPSLFIGRFTNKLRQRRNIEDIEVSDEDSDKVSTTALRIVASMKRDWMQTGRKPSGLCGAAIYISALSHGFTYLKSDIVRVVHMCEATLTKRLIEFENTESGSLTMEEFDSKAADLEDELKREAKLRKQTNVEKKSSGTMELLCKHKGDPHFAHGLCGVCYNDFIEISGGLEGGLEPPAFQRAERDRMAKAAAEEKAAELSLFEKEVECSSKTDHDVIESNKPDSRPSGSIGAAIAPAVDEGASAQSHCDEDTNTVPGDEDTNTVPGGEATNTVSGDEDTNTVPGDESESLSDIDDAEVVGYLHNEEERRYKEILWVEMNKEYVEEQALKEAAAAAAKKVREAQYENCSEELRAQMELAELSQAAVAKSRKERQRKKAAEAKNMPPPQTVQEAAHRELVKKRLSSKINFDAFEVLFDDSVSENTKKARTDDPGTRIVNSNVNQVVAEEDDEEDYSGTTYDGAADDSCNKYGYGDDDGFEDYGYEF